MRVAVVAGPDPGHAFPALALAAALRRRGHDVVMATGTRWRAAVEGEGCRWVTIPHSPPDPRDDDFGFRLWGRGGQTAPRLAETLAPLRPEVVVADVLTIAGWFAADLLGVPRIELVPVLLQLPSRVLPPPGSALRPGRTPVGKARDAVLRALYERSQGQGRAQRDAARAAIGLPPGGAPVARLVATLPALEWPRPDWPADTYVVGPLVWEPPGTPLPLPEGDGPLVLVTDSTARTPARGGLVAAALAALPSSGLRVVATSLTPVEGVVPAGAVVGTGPQDPVLACAAAVVAPGGHGLVVKALRRGVPLVLVPGPGDQRANAARVASLGCGITIEPARLTPERLRTAVLEVIGNPRYRAAAQVVARSGDGLGADHAAHLVECLVGGLGDRILPHSSK